ncbi:hypothetical protein [Piscinibacter sakaiensis]|uniref:hypothetical protein n=1 Tax=Piscinibacter sakaiensis TaxID=1547922 RepID=UPI003AAABC83
MFRRKAKETTAASPPRKAELIAQVVAWHNRHPLARRIDAMHVNGIGIVALPFAEAAAGKRPKPLFSGDFLAPLKAAAIARLAWRHGSRQPSGHDDWPRRDVAVDAGRAAAAIDTRFVNTAAIEIGSRRIRVLLGVGPRPQILGRRALSERRIVGLFSIAASLALGSVATVSWWPQPAGALAQAAVAGPGGAVLAAPAALPAAEQAVAGADAAPAEPVDDTTTTVATASADAEPQDAPAEPEPNEPEGRKTGQEPAEHAPAKHAAATPPATITAVAPDTTSIAVQPLAQAEPRRPAATPAVPAASDDGGVYALATASTGSRLASELRIGFLNVPTEPAADRPHAELVRVGARWRVVIWPFGSRGAAESLRQALAERGLKTELIAF